MVFNEFARGVFCHWLDSRKAGARCLALYADTLTIVSISASAGWPDRIDRWQQNPLWFDHVYVS